MGDKADSQEPQPEAPLEMAVVRRNRFIMGLAALPAIALLAALVAGALVNSAFLLLLPHGLLLSAIALWFAWGWNPWPRLELEPFVVHGEELWVGGRCYQRSTLTNGFVVPGGGCARVVLERGALLPAIELQAVDEAEGRQLLRSLGLDVDQSLAVFRGMSRLHTNGWLAAGVNVLLSTLMVGLGVAMGQLFGGGGAALCFGLVLIAMLVLNVAPARVEVGADGVLLRWLGHKRFIPHGEIVDAQVALRGQFRSRRKVVVLQLASGGSLDIPVATAMFDFGRASALAARIRQAVAGRARAGDSAHLEALPRRVGSYLDWVRALRAQLSSHRSGHLPVDRLWRVIEDPQGPATERAAAAVSLSEKLSSPDRSRLKQVAEATAAPRLRIVLDALCEQAEEEQLVEALAELEASEAKQ